MINLNQWIYSKDIAKWLKDQEPLSVTEQINHVCSDVPAQQYIYRTEIFYHGEREKIRENLPIMRTVSV